MARRDYAAAFKQETLVRLIRAFLSGNFVAEVSRIPERMAAQPYPDIAFSPAEMQAFEKMRCMAGLGFGMEQGDRSVPLAEYARQALDRTEIKAPVLSILHVGCHRCAADHFEVTNACQGCLARPCTSCPFGAIDFIDGKSHIIQEKCKKCGICARSCPYHAIIRHEPPCMAVCPVQAIAKGEAGVAVINPDTCISCGACSVACPFGAVVAKSQLIDVLKAIRSGKQVVALLAPAILGQFEASAGQIFTAVLKAGFSDVTEVAHGADVAARAEAHELAERLRKGDPFMTTSCCPAYFIAVKKHLPELAAYVSTTRTPMHYTARSVKEKNPDAVSVFIGPCMAKREEGIADEYVDFVLNGRELEALFTVLGIVPKTCAEIPVEAASKQGRGCPISGGVAAAIASLKTCAVCSVAVPCLTKETMAKLREYAQNKKADGNLIEVMACAGGCIAGPGVSAPVKKSEKEIRALMEAAPELKIDG